MRFYTHVAACIAALHASTGVDAMSVQADTSWRRSYNGVAKASTPPAEVGLVVPTAPGTGTPFPVQQGPTWTGTTGTSFLPEEAIARAEDGNPIEKAKLAKDASTAFNSV